VTFALQETSRSGTAHALVGLGLGGLNAAGKTGTSNDQRDSWFAGYTGSHLAVAWVGTDDNKETGLYGATGALKVWAALFQRLPTTPLKLTLGKDPELAWVDMQYAALTDANCPGARELPFAQGYSPAEFLPCGEGSTYGADAAGQPHKAESLGSRIRRWFERPKKEAGDKDEQ
jgi:penicillin-binding protein 1B